MTTSVPQTKPPGTGWVSWQNPYAIKRREPYDYAEVEAWREGWSETKLIDPHDCNPLMNIANLYWRPAGPALTEEAKLQKAVQKLLRRDV